MQLNALKDESDFLSENLQTVTTGIVRLNKNVVFCSDCSGTSKCLKEPVPADAERLPVPDTLSEVIPTSAEEYHEQVRKTNDLLRVYGLPSIAVSNNNECHE